MFYMLNVGSLRFAKTWLDVSKPGWRRPDCCHKQKHKKTKDSQWKSDYVVFFLLVFECEQYLCSLVRQF